MSRTIGIAAAQLGPIHLADTRAQVVKRLIALLEEAHAAIDAYFEIEMPGPENRPLFDRALELEMGFYIGYAELTEEDGETKHYNTSILVAPDGKLIGKYRKIHLPGHSEHLPEAPFQHLEKKFFDIGNLGFPVWRTFDGIVGMCICNDRRWPETFRVMGVELRRKLAQVLR